MRANLSQSAMRRDVSLGSTFRASLEGKVVKLAGIRAAATVAPPPVPIEDSTMHAEQRGGAHQRVFIRPAANMESPALVYGGRDIDVGRF